MSSQSHRRLLAPAIAALLALALAVPVAYAATPVNARGTDVAAPDQQSPMVDARGTDVAAVDQQAPRADTTPRTGPVPVIEAPDDALPTSTLLALITLVLVGALTFASRLAAGRRRSRAAA